MKRISIPEAGMRVSRCAILQDVGQTADTDTEQRRVGLCFDCEHAQQIRSDRGSTFYRCKLSDTDPTFPKYPRLPVLQCAGYTQKGQTASARD
jgi:hypothetical protein